MPRLRLRRTWLPLLYESRDLWAAYVGARCRVEAEFSRANRLLGAGCLQGWAAERVLDLRGALSARAVTTLRVRRLNWSGLPGSNGPEAGGTAAYAASASSSLPWASSHSASARWRAFISSAYLRFQVSSSPLRSVS